MVEEQDIKNKIHRLEYNLLRCKDFNEQLRIHYVLQEFNKQLSAIRMASQKKLAV